MRYTAFCLALTALCGTAVAADSGDPLSEVLGLDLTVTPGVSVSAGDASAGFAGVIPSVSASSSGVSGPVSVSMPTMAKGGSCYVPCMSSGCGSSKCGGGSGGSSLVTSISIVIEITINIIVQTTSPSSCPTFCCTGF